MHQGQPIDPRLHVFAMRLSYRLVGIIQATCVRKKSTRQPPSSTRAIVADTQEYEQKTAR